MKAEWIGMHKLHLKHKLSDMNDKSFVDHMMCTMCYEWTGNLDVTPPCFLGAALSEH